jgi:hypothetical protein
VKLDGDVQAVATIRAFFERRSEIAAAWAELDDLLETLASSGETMDFWLRDDDVVAPTAALDRFLAQLARFSLPVGLAAIPARLEQALAERLAGERRVRLLVHGYGHKNHAPANERAAEFGAHRSVEAMHAELVDGLARLRATFGPQALPVFVPPWNRIDEALARCLPAWGYAGLSTFAARQESGGPPGFVQANCHWDPIDWKGKRGLKPEARLIRELCLLIRSQRDRPLAMRHPIGLLTHHLVHDGWIERFLERLFARLAGAPAIRFLEAEAVFGLIKSRET